MASDIGMMIDGRYEVLSELGRGGMGVVYKAMDTKMDCVRAIKLMTGQVQDRGEFHQRFLNEAKAVAKMHHPGIVVVHDYGDHAGQPYMAMEYVEGKPLDKIIAAGANLSLVTKLDYVIQVCQALHYAHQFGLVHRDVKPANVIVLEDMQRIKLLDFGIARVGAASMLSKSGIAMGTIYYMSPQQIRGEKNLDRRADIFAAGVMLYELLAGTLPWNGDSEFAVMTKIINEPYPALSAYLRQYPPGLERILDRALSKEVEQRYQTAEDMAGEIAELQTPLKAEMLDEARVCFAGGDALGAYQLVTDLLRVDIKNGEALELRSKLMQTGNIEQKIEELKQLRASAEVALGQRRYQDALTSIEQAIALHPTSAELLKYRDLIRNELKRREDIHRRLELASRAQEMNDYASAKDLVEKALELDPTDTQARMMNSVLLRKLEEEGKQKRIRDMAEDTQRLLASRRYTEAYEVIRNIESLDPQFPALVNLKKATVEGQNQEKRRRELESLIREVQQVVTGNDLAKALAATEQALAKFPGDPTLTKLRKQAEAKQSATERDRGIQEQLAIAGRLKQEGHVSEALRVIEEAGRRFGMDTRLRSAQEQIRDAADRERGLRVEQQVLESARHAIRERRFDSAVRILSVAHADYPDSETITEALRAARDAAAKHSAESEAARQQQVAQSLHSMLAAEPRPEEQLHIVEDALRSTPGNAALQSMLEQIRARNARYSQAVMQAEADTVSGQYAEAIRAWEVVREIYPQYPGLEAEMARLKDLLKPRAPEPIAPPAQPAPRGLSSATDILNASAVRQIMQQMDAQASAPPAAPPPVAAPEPAQPSAAAAAPKRAPAKEKRKAARPVEVAPPVYTRPEPKPEPHFAAPPEPPKGGSNKLLLWGGLSIAAVIVIVVAVLMWPSPKPSGTGTPGETTPATSAGTTTGSTTTTKPSEPPKPVLGTVDVTTSVDGVSIYADKKLEAVTDGNKAKLALAPGHHEIVAKKPGYQDKTQGVEVAANSETSANFALDKSAEPVVQPDPNLIVHSTPNASVSIDNQEIGVVGQNGTFSTSFKPGRHKLEITAKDFNAYKGSINGKLGETVKVSAELVAIPKPAPVIAAFNAEPAQIQAGQSATLSWNASNATSFSIDPGVGGVSNGSVKVSPKDTTTYTLTAVGEGGKSTRTVTVSVAAVPKPVISLFTLGSDKITAGMSTKLIWQTQHASRVELNGGQVEANGQQEVNPKTDTSYTLKVTGAGGSDSQTVKLTVAAAPVSPQPVQAGSERDADVDSIKAVIQKFRDAYSLRDPDAERAVWPNIPPARAKADQDEFNNRAWLSLTLQLDCTLPARVTGDSLTAPCQYKTERRKAGGKGIDVNGPHPVSVTFQKLNGHWVIGGITGR